METDIKTVVQQPVWATKEVRLTWRIGNKTGNGLWFPASAQGSVKAAVDQGNRAHGAATHWLEERAA